MPRRTSSATLVVTLSMIALSQVGPGAPRVSGAFPGANGLLTLVQAGQVFGIDPVSGAATPLTQGYAAAWASDGRRLAVNRFGGPGIDVLVVGPDGAEQNLTADVDGQAGEPAWSPDGGHIVYAEDSNLPVLTIVRADGTERRSIDLSGTLEHVGSPAWSPDGSHIVISGMHSPAELFHPTDVWLVDAADGGLAPLTFDDDPLDAQEGSYSPDWSPDGSRIVFERHVVGVPPEIRDVAADGGDERVLVADGQPNARPVWAPDGTRIAYTVDTADGTLVRIIDTEGALVDELLASEGDAFLVDWQVSPT